MKVARSYVMAGAFAIAIGSGMIVSAQTSILKAYPGSIGQLPTATTPEPTITCIKAPCPGTSNLPSIPAQKSPMPLVKQPVAKPGNAYFSIQELLNGRIEVNLRNALVTGIATTSVQQEVQCITAPCPAPTTATLTTLNIEVLGMSLTINVGPQTKLLERARAAIKLDRVQVGDYVNVYGFQSKTDSSVVDANIVRVVSILQKLPTLPISPKEPIYTGTSTLNQKPATVPLYTGTPAINQKTGEVKMFSSPGQIPEGWAPLKTYTSTISR